MLRQGAAVKQQSESSTGQANWPSSSFQSASKPVKTSNTATGGTAAMQPATSPVHLNPWPIRVPTAATGRGAALRSEYGIHWAIRIPSLRVKPSSRIDVITPVRTFPFEVRSGRIGVCGHPAFELLLDRKFLQGSRARPVLATGGVRAAADAQEERQD